MRWCLKPLSWPSNSSLATVWVVIETTSLPSSCTYLLSEQNPPQNPTWELNPAKIVF